MKNKILMASLVAVLSVFSLATAQNYDDSCVPINYSALSTVNDGIFEAKGWLKQADEYAKQSNNADALNQALSIYANIIQDNGLDADVIVAAYQGINQLIKKSGKFLSMACIQNDIVRASNNYWYANSSDDLAIKPDPSIIQEIEPLIELLKTMPIRDDLSLYLILRLYFSENIEAQNKINHMVQNKVKPFNAVLQAYLDSSDENLQAFLVYSLPKDLTDDEIIELYSLIQSFSYHKNEDVKNKSLELTHQILKNNLHIEYLQKEVGNGYTGLENDLVLLESVVNEQSSVDAQIALANLYYRYQNYERHYQILEKLAKEGHSYALSELVSYLFVSKRELNLSEAIVKDWIDQAIVMDQKIHDVKFAQSLLNVYQYHALNNLDPIQYAPYARRIIFNGYRLEEAQKFYQEMIEVAEYLEKLQILIRNGEGQAAYELWDKMGYYVFQDDVTVLRQIADLNISQAQYRTALGYEKEQKQEEALKYFMKAAENGNKNAGIALVYAYIIGENNALDRDQAIHYFNLAHRDDNEDSGYGNYDKEKIVYATVYQWMKENPNEEAIQYLDKEKFLIQSIRLDKDAPM
ncbi:tetratricopeptide repeat protein, partial [Wohlfahrtiimonas larvae]